MEIVSRFKNYTVDFVDSLAYLWDLAELEETFFVIDAQVYELYQSSLPKLSPEKLYLVNAVEDKKNINTVLDICEKMTAMKSKRNTQLISIGGGIVQDITGFVASSLYRGIRWTFYPSTLLAACDSCIGGKSSLNYKGFKNLLGSFYPPDEIFIYPEFFHTLTPRDYCSGLGEVVKFNVIAGEDGLDRIEQDIDAILEHDYTKLSEYVHSSLVFKKKFIEEDEFDRGVRILLNFAHTFGHALETVTNYAVPHGSAVAMGMMIANDISVQRGLLQDEYANRIRNVCKKILVNIQVKAEWADVENLVRAIRKDKKQTGASINAVLLQDDAGLSVFKDITVDEIEHAVKKVFGRFKMNKKARDVVRHECPVCGRKNVDNIDYFMRDYSGYSAIAPYSYYDVFACKGCGMVYAGNMIESMPLDTYYAKISRYEGDNFILSSTVHDFYSREADFLEKYIDKNAAILDIGCAFGGLLNILKERGFRNLNGLEPSLKNAEYAKKKFDIDVYQGGLGMESFVDKQYDVIIMSGVLEHLLDLRTCMDEIKLYLKENGMLFIVVPDIDDFYNNDDLYQEFSVEHINYFSLKSLKNFFNKYDISLYADILDVVPLHGLARNSFSLWKVGNGQFCENFSFTSLEKYLENSKTLAIDVIKKFKSFDKSNGFYIWGAGTQTAMLYQLNCFPYDAVKGIVDSNMNYHGESIYGNVIEKPDVLLEWPNRPLFISSQYAQKAIIEQISNMGLKNEIWFL